MASEFWVPLSAARYDPQLGWFCSVLSQSNAKVSEFRLGDKTIPLEQIVFDKSHIRLVSLKENRLADAAAKISFTAKPFGLDTNIWVAIITVGGTVTAAYIANTKKSDAPAVNKATVSVPAQETSIPASTARPQIVATVPSSVAQRPAVVPASAASSALDIDWTAFRPTPSWLAQRPAVVSAPTASQPILIDWPAIRRIASSVEPRPALAPAPAASLPLRIDWSKFKSAQVWVFPINNETALRIENGLLKGKYCQVNHLVGEISACYETAWECGVHRDKTSICEANQRYAFCYGSNHLGSEIQTRCFETNDTCLGSAKFWVRFGEVLRESCTYLKF